MSNEFQAEGSPFRDGLALGELRYARCGACGHVLNYGACLCPACGASEVAWVSGSGRGRLRACAIYHRSYAEGLNPPYAVAVVELEEGPRLLARLFSAEPPELAPGMPVRACFEQGGLRFVPEPAA